jgi:hypothetical protein
VPPGPPPDLFLLSAATLAPCCSYLEPVHGTLTISLNGGPATVYPFELVEPVPEPGTLLLVEAGLGLAGWRRRAAWLAERMAPAN